MPAHAHQTTSGARRFLKAHTAGLEGCEAVSTGLCGTCPQCQADWNMEPARFYSEVENGTVFSEGFFSWRGCDICGSRLGGTFEPWHYVSKADGKIRHGARACIDCMMFLANGDLPDEWGEGDCIGCDTGGICTCEE